ncbi:MAG: hypothetical protein ACREKF_13300 [Candidatus Methylomirabilales bacterium]
MGMILALSPVAEVGGAGFLARPIEFMVPFAVGGRQLRLRMGGEGEDLMPLFRRKTSAADRAAAYRVTRPTAEISIPSPFH